MNNMSEFICDMTMDSVFPECDILDKNFYDAGNVSCTIFIMSVLSPMNYRRFDIQFQRSPEYGLKMQNEECAAL